MEIVIFKENVRSVLILEDSPERILWFEKIFNFATLIFVTKDTKAAVTALENTKFDLIFLDHDLDEDRDQNTEDTGLFVARKIKDTMNKETECIIHSMNPQGAADMVLAHPFNTAHIPFSMLRDSLEVR